MATSILVNASKHEGVMVLELSAPPANTYSYEMMKQLDAHVLDARFDPAVHVILITGAGEKFFCAGADIKMLESADPYFKNDGAL
jgi:enoyl-CoA hydratase/carnithine racemase